MCDIGNKALYRHHHHTKFRLWHSPAKVFFWIHHARSASGPLMFLVKPSLAWTGARTTVQLLMRWSLLESRWPFFSCHSQIRNILVWTTWIWKSKSLGSLWNFILSSNLNNLLQIDLNVVSSKLQQLKPDALLGKPLKFTNYEKKTCMWTCIWYSQD